MASAVPLPDEIYKQYLRDPRLTIGQSAGQAGSQTTPVGSPMEALARVLQGALGGYMTGAAKEDATKQAGEYSDTLARALRVGTGQENTFDSKTGDWSAPTGTANEDSAKAMARVLASNTATAPMGLQMTMGDIESQRKLAQALSLKKAELAAEAPKTRTYKADGKEVTEEWKPGAGWSKVGSADIPGRNVQTVTTHEGVFVLNPDQSLGPRLGGRPAEKEAAGGPFAGNAMDAQAYNILLTGDPKSPTYAAAFNHVASPRSTVDATTGDIITTRPDMSAFRAPAMGQPQAPQGAPQGGPPAAGGGMPQEPGAGPQAAPQPSPQPMPGQPQNFAVPGSNVTITPGGQGRMTEAQTRDATFADRLKSANQVLANFDTQGSDFWQNVKNKAPLGLGSTLTSPEYQQFDQAKRDFINAVLRKESGAVIAETEFANAEKQYFPQPGDSEKVIEQKRRNRAEQVTGMARAAGPTYNRSVMPKDAGSLYSKYGLEGR